MNFNHQFWFVFSDTREKYKFNYKLISLVFERDTNSLSQIVCDYQETKHNLNDFNHHF